MKAVKCEMILVTLLCVFTRLVFTFLHSVDGACTFVLQHTVYTVLAPCSNHRPFETTIMSTKDNDSPLFTTEEFASCYLFLCVFKVLLFIVSLQKES